MASLIVIPTRIGGPDCAAESLDLPRFDHSSQNTSDVVIFVSFLCAITARLSQRVVTRLYIGGGEAVVVLVERKVATGMPIQSIGGVGTGHMGAGMVHVSAVTEIEIGLRPE